MKLKIATSTMLLLAGVLSFSCKKEGKYETKTGESNGFSYEYVTNDPLQARIYTLKNGLKVYLSQYKAEPRIMTSIAVKAGGKFDPSNATGLAHYLEHIMFKGTGDFGTQAWDKENVLLDSIEHMFEYYRTLSDSVQRTDFYKKIDKASNDASRFAIANEYDKMVSEIGAKGTNAYTTEDRTVYVNDIPANQVENWLTIESNRFRKIVPRLFHTELEAVYEEKNRSLDNDYWKTYDAINKAAFKKHPYGTQTVIGTIDHLKNPSITEIKKYFYKYYRPNNVAICMSGDLDYDKTIALIDTYFGSWEPNPELKNWEPIVEDEITKPVNVDVYGPDSEWLNIAFRFKGNPEDAKLLRLTDMILSNSQAGLIDLNLKQQQKVLEPTSYVTSFNDYALHVFSGKPREGQTLDDVKKLLLDQVELLKKGQFDDWLIAATINDLKKISIQQSQYNGSRSNDEVMAFTNGIPWRDYISRTDDLHKFTRQDIIKFANAHYKDNYIAVYKRHGKDPHQQKVTKPTITKVSLNKESKSPFHEKLLANKVEKIQPVFLDYEKDIQKLKMSKGVDVLYTKNSENELFTLYYLSDAGTNNNPKMKQAVEYLEYLGTSDMTSEDVKKEFYKIGCGFGVFAADEQTYVYLNGLSENMDKAITLFEKLLADPKPDEEALKKMVDGIFKKRDDIKKDKGAILWEGLMNYGLYGARSPFTNVLANKELRELKAAELADIVKGFTKTQHRVLYYGPKSEDELLVSLNKGHRLPDQLQPVPAPVEFKIKSMEKPAVYWANYDMVQAEIIFLSKGEPFDAARYPMIRMFNEYFGGSMASPVFQELREAQGLAYSAFAAYRLAGKKSDNDSFFGYIGTQADKQTESMKAMMGLIQDFPKSESGFEVARTSILNQLESERITKTNILFNYETAKRRGVDHDIRKDAYEQIQNMTIEDIANFQKDYIKGRKFNVVLVGDQKKLNLKNLQQYGDVKELTLDDLFGYEKPLRVNKEGPNQ
ncbi:MAG TPA: insulinase family protein [Cyclobacteriaceae bacterium]|nr:insulinase family protein [Cyclobacteriaceae bacterium]